MKLALLGTGMIVQELLPVLAELDIRPRALLGTERSRERAMELAARFGIEGVYFQYEALLEDSGADTVYIGLPNALHFDCARRALLRGLHVIVEKPAVPTLAEFLELRRLAEDRGLILLEAMTIPHQPAFRQMVEDVRRLGPVRTAILNYSQYSSRYDAFLQGTVAPAFDPGQAGGALMDLNVYNLHLALHLFGPPETVHYQASVRRGIDTGGVLTLGYPDKTVACVGAKDCQGANFSCIQGEAGRMAIAHHVSFATGVERVFRSGVRERRETPRPRHRLSYEFEAFREILDGSRMDRVSELLDVSEAAVRILETARKQAWGL